MPRNSQPQTLPQTLNPTPYEVWAAVEARDPGAKEPNYHFPSAQERPGQGGLLVEPDLWLLNEVPSVSGFRA